MDDDTRLVQNVVKLMKQQFHKVRRASQIAETEEDPAFHVIVSQASIQCGGQTTLVAFSSGGGPGEGYEDVPCRDAASCKKLEHLVNRCNYIRSATGGSTLSIPCVPLAVMPMPPWFYFLCC
ncbi:membrane related protein [Cyclospora cayetanensis]|uniref:Membrane related protein n=1 Tax=Cyclospora cayetanensis TaxID=88456 RepID=A0A1D3D6B5_9EIME|nr:membrane related protein [Cyclospora cayetanensis]